jgi:hypothetical protein
MGSCVGWGWDLRDRIVGGRLESEGRGPTDSNPGSKCLSDGMGSLAKSPCSEIFYVGMAWLGWLVQA